MILATSSKRIEYLSPCFSGKTHDVTVLKSVFSPDGNWFENHIIQGDLGYLGFDKAYESDQVELPHKKPKGGELSDEQKVDNQKLSRERVAVEHSIGGMKRYRILSNRLRMHNLTAYDRKLEVCAGLWNFYLSN